MRVHAYFDGELDVLSAAEVERHSASCAECRDLLRDLEQMRTALRHDLTYEGAPPALRARIMRTLDQESAVKSSRPSAERHKSWRPRPFWQGAFSGIGGTAIAAGIAFFLLAPPLTNPLLDDLPNCRNAPSTAPPSFRPG
jgi:anti-sigma factor RsiW